MDKGQTPKKVHNLDDVLLEVYDLYNLGYYSIARLLLPSVLIYSGLIRKSNKKIMEYNFAFSYILRYIHGPNFQLHPKQNSKLPIHINSKISIEDLNEYRRKYPKYTKNAHYDYLNALFYCKYDLFSKSLEYFNKASKYFNNLKSISFYSDWGHALFNSGEYKNGNAKFQYAVEIDPNNWWIYSKWAACLSNHSFKKESTIKDNLAINLNPKELRFYFDAGYRIVKNQLNYLDELDILIRKAKNVDIDTFSFLKVIGIKYYRENEFEIAHNLFCKANKVYSHNWETHSWLGKTLYHLLEYEEAITELEKAFALDANNSFDNESKYLLKDALMKMQRGLEAERIIISNNYKFGIIEDPLQNIVDKISIGDYKSAISDLLKQLEICKEYDNMRRAEIWKEIAFCYKRLNNKEKFESALAYSEEETTRLRKSLNSIQDINDLKVQLKDVLKQSDIIFPILSQILDIPLHKVTSEILTKKNVLVLKPKNPVNKKSEHMNEIVWFDQNGYKEIFSRIKDRHFDFLYYIAWLHNHGKKGLKREDGISNEHKNEIFPKHVYYDRLNSKALIGDSKQMISSRSELKNILGIDFINQHGVSYILIKNISIELKPYPT